jgi:hypothetical protein
MGGRWKQLFSIRVQRRARRCQAFGTAAWIEKTVKSFALQSTQRRPGRPRRASHIGQLAYFAENGSCQLSFLPLGFL